MGNPLLGSDVALTQPAPISAFYSDDSWIEGNAVLQLEQAASLNGVKQIAAFPDLHPGKYGPVGCAVLADRIYPQLIGNDIGCGMSVFVLDVPARKLKLNKLVEKFYRLDDEWHEEARKFLSENKMDVDHHVSAFATLGGGNHFCELQEIVEINETALSPKYSLSKGQTLLMIHSGSRSLGYEIFSTLATDAFNGLAADSDQAVRYMERHNHAVRWAGLNRKAIAQRVADFLRVSFQLLIDNPHNSIECTGAEFLHRKGAAKADMPLVPLAGSRDAASYLVAPSFMQPDALDSIAHGSGRKYDRKSMMGRVGKTRAEREALAQNANGGPIICADRQSLIEEAPSAYKDPKKVLADLIRHNLVQHAVTMKPLLTYKKRPQAGSQKRQEKRERLLSRRRDR